jgi:hypothetical protein
MLATLVWHLSSGMTKGKFPEFEIPEAEVAKLFDARNSKQAQALAIGVLELITHQHMPPPELQRLLMWMSLHLCTLGKQPTYEDGRAALIS